MMKTFKDLLAIGLVVREFRRPVITMGIEVVHLVTHELAGLPIQAMVVMVHWREWQGMSVERTF